MANFDVNSTTIESIINSIKVGEIAIPEIQRPFVWTPTKVRDLLDSLYKGFPIGYIIVWKNPDVRMKDGSISTGKKIIIDGQQRITAIQAAIVGDEVVDSSYKKSVLKLPLILLKGNLRFVIRLSKKTLSGYLIFPLFLIRTLINGRLLGDFVKTTVFLEKRLKLITN